MLSDIITENGLDLGIATTGNDSIIMSQLPPEQLAYFSASPFPDAIALLEGDDNVLNDNTGRIFYGNQGSDTIIGGGGNDTIFGGQDDDFLEAGGGNSILFGNLGNDTLIGGPGNDSLYGGTGNDVIIGGLGNSVISGDKGLDTLTGGGGANQFILASSGADQDVITDFQPGIDKMPIPTGLTFADLEVRGSGANTEILRNGEVVAILNGVISSSINSNDFITAGQETSPSFDNVPVWLSTGDGAVGIFNPQTGIFSAIGTGVTLTDIAFDGSTLWGLNSSDLYRINLNTEDYELVGTLDPSININGLELDSQGKLYATGEQYIFEVNPINGSASIIGNGRSQGFRSSGDLAFDERKNLFYSTSSGSDTDDLFSITADGIFTRIGPIGFPDVFGLRFRDSNLYGYTSNSSEILINTNTGSGSFVQFVQGGVGEIFGAS
ncbi:hypothetical protein [Limnoraphis robusta]|uniref:Calcium-binding protein n=1 Tax=Limnoraphis robusta CCNP1315 TaxID=3110306 RepID=A0ABU5TX19_9CYAN|nr:hypothetical protein [Limnoraphis robusta]MEA5519419.1 hypothetical protein [Limnoraphis robusta CCNP1315]MEA5549125.1 hypothetical protein [Limnoraphis robusta CCNP1324]